MSIFSAWANGATVSMSTMGGSAPCASAPSACAGSQAGRQGGGTFAATEQAAPRAGFAQQQQQMQQQQRASFAQQPQQQQRASFAQQPQQMQQQQLQQQRGGFAQQQSQANLVTESADDRAVQLTMAVQGVDHAGLIASDTLRRQFEASMKATLISSSKSVRMDDMVVELSGGSVIAKVGMSPAMGSTGDAVVSDLEGAKPKIAKNATSNVKAIPGIKAVTNGEISVSVLDIKANEQGPPPPVAGAPPPMAPPVHGSYGMEAEEVAQKCAAPPVYEHASQVASTVVSQQTSPVGAQQMTPMTQQPAAAAPQQASPQRGAGNQRGAQKGRGGRQPAAQPAAQSPPQMKGSPDDIKHLLKDLQASNVKKETIAPVPQERQMLDVPEQAEEEFEKQLRKVSALTDTKQKPDLTGTLQDMKCSDPPAHIQGLALREALREISGKKTEEE